MLASEPTAALRGAVGGLSAASPAVSSGRAEVTRGSSGFQATLWTCGGIVASLMVLHGSVPPLRTTVILAAALAALALLTATTRGLSILPRLALLLYALPFSATLGFLFDSEFIWWDTPLVSPYCRDPSLNVRLVWIGICGLAGMAAGIHFRAAIGAPPRPLAPTVPKRVLGAAPFFGLLVIAVGLSQLAAPSETVWEAAYSAEQSKSASVEMNFNGSFLVSYLILILLYVDSENEPLGSPRRREKVLWIAAAGLYIVIVLQLMRGDRECTGLVTGIAALYLTSGQLHRERLIQHKEALRRVIRIAAPLLVLLVLLISLGFLRSTLSSGGSVVRELASIPKRALTVNTWTAVLLTNLGMAAEEATTGIEPLNGQTYVGYLLSLPPGAFTKAIGYDRPMDGNKSPNWWYIPLSAGGIHPCVVPYNNFGIFGVFGVMAAIGYFATRCELFARGYGFSNRLLYGCVVTVSMLWLWYGDMNIIRGVMGCGILLVLHRLCSKPADPEFATALPRI